MRLVELVMMSQSDLTVQDVMKCCCSVIVQQLCVVLDWAELVVDPL